MKKEDAKDIFDMFRANMPQSSMRFDETKMKESITAAAFFVGSNDEREGSHYLLLYESTFKIVVNPLRPLI